jgi:hypothetical protein
VNALGTIAARQQITEDWWGKLDGELLDCLGVGPMSAAELGTRLGISEHAAVSLLSMMAREGKIRISRVELTSGPGVDA